jgi:hypothetical protein
MGLDIMILFFRCETKTLLQFRSFASVAAVRSSVLYVFFEIIVFPPFFPLRAYLLIFRFRCSVSVPLMSAVFMYLIHRGYIGSCSGTQSLVDKSQQRVEILLSV